jgi:hypothetical protein
MAGDRDDSLTATDVIRCVWLARMAAQRGDTHSARRWQTMADRWLEQQFFIERDFNDTLGISDTRGPSDSGFDVND